jgi:hypothetical protein
MTFLDAALKILSREKRPLHFKELTERAMTKKLLTFVGRTPEVSMQQALTAAVKKAPGNPFVRVKPGVFGLLRYPELPPEEPEPETEKAADKGDRKSGEHGDSRRDGEPGEGGRGRRRRRRGGRGRGRDEARAENGTSEGAAASEGAEGADEDLEGSDEPNVRGLSAAAQAAALAETGVLEGDDDDDDAEGEELMSSGSGSATEEEAGVGEESGAGAPVGDELGGGFAAAAGEDEDGDEDEDEDEDGEGAEAGAAAEGAPRAPGEAGREEGSGRRRRRRRRRRGGGGEFGEGAPRTEGGEGGYSGGSSEAGAGGEAAASGEGGEARAEGPGPEPEGPRRIMTPVDAAIEVLKGHPAGRGVHVRQIADAAARRRLVHGEPNEAWRVMRAGLAAEPRERLRAGQRPRVRAAGSGLYALSRRPPDAELERAEYVFGEARRALRERTIAGLERRIADLPGPAFEALARVLLQREGFGPATFVKRVEGTIYIEALRGRGAGPSRVLIALRSGGATAGRRAVGELRAGIKARGQDEGLLMLAGRLGDDAIGEWKRPTRSGGEGQDGAAPPIEIADGQAMAETCVRHGVGVINANVSVDFIDADFFSELAEG